ncbi:hypothetical protein [Streptomyces sp. B6(2022)]
MVGGGATFEEAAATLPPETTNATAVNTLSSNRLISYALPKISRF